MNRAVRLLDATLRDGSYCVDFQFTRADVAVIVGELDAAGVGFIELGHGGGTFQHRSAMYKSTTRQAAPDEEYLAVARRCAKTAKLGVITGLFGKQDLPILAQHGFDFVRFACMADRALEPANLEMTERAKAAGLTFSINLMQTQAVPPARVAEIAVEYAKAGCDWFYVVDSSGGMLSHQVTEYVARASEASAMAVGFHAHHNSGMAIANCLAALDAGATMLDGTLQGLGRDIGNAPTEQLLFMMQKVGHERAVDVDRVSKLGDLVRGLLLEKGHDPTYMAAGASEIHSSNVEALVAVAHARGLEPRSLVAAIGHGDQKLIGAGMKTFPEAIIEPACARAARVVEPTPRHEVVDVLADEIVRASTPELGTLVDVLFARATKWHMRSVLHLVPAAQLPFHGPLPWDFAGLCGITVGVDRLPDLAFGDRQPSVLVIDPALAPPAGSATACLIDAFQPIVVQAALALAAVGGAPAWFACADAAIAAQFGDRAVTDLANVATGDMVIVVGPADLPADIAALAARGVRLLRPPIATGIGARIATLLDVRARLAGAVDGTLVDPIFVPTAGQVVVDDPTCPTTMLGERGRDQALAAAAVRATTLARGLGRL